MTEQAINLSNQIRQKKRCVICTGCGRCAWTLPDIDVVTGSENGSWQKDIEKSAVIAEGTMAADQYMIAADIGTTTIAMQLRRVSDGQVLDTFRAINPQRKYGADVLSRIAAADGRNEVGAGETGGQAMPTTVEKSVAEEMRQQVLGVLEEGVCRLCQGDRRMQDVRGGQIVEMPKGADNIVHMFIAANTTMIYLLMGYPPDSLGKVPFYAEHLEEIETVISGIPTTILPGISAFVGADILAGMYACKMSETEEINLLVDLGTNGEMALGNKNRILATATAAGPAFEGCFNVGVWGADAVKFLAGLLEKGLMDDTGLLTEEYFEQGVTIGSITMTQENIRSLQLAKAAVYAGVQILCEKYGLHDISEIQNVYLAGGFGYYLNSGDAAKIGLLPEELTTKVKAMGNTALQGAFCYGREKYWQKGKTQEKIRRLREKTEAFDLAETDGFSEQYISAIHFTKAR